MHHVGLLLMTHREVDHHDRVGLAAVAAWALALGFLMWADPSRYGDLWAPWLWGTMLAAGGVLAVCWAAYPASEQLRALSGAAIVSGLAGRGWAMGYGLVFGTNRVAVLLLVFGVVLWGLLAAALLVIWQRLLPAPGH